MSDRTPIETLRNLTEGTPILLKTRHGFGGAHWRLGRLRLVRNPEGPGQIPYLENVAHTFATLERIKLDTLEDVTQLSDNAPALHLAELGILAVGTRVTVRHFGNLYLGKVIAIKRTRIEVAFTTRGGDRYARWKPVLETWPDPTVRQVLEHRKW